MLTSRTSRWSLGTALLCIILLVASWFLLISPRRADASAVRGQVTQADSQAAQLQMQIAQLKAEFAGLPKRRAELTAIKKQLPPKADIPTLVRDLQNLAAQTGVSLDSIAPGAPTVLTATGVAAPTTAAAGSVVGVPMAITVTGDYFEASLFIKYLQTKLPRSYLISGLAVTPADVTAATTANTAPTATGTATPTVTATTAPAVETATSTGPVGLSVVQLGIEGSIFVLLDGTSTLEDVKKEAEAAADAAKSEATPTPSSTSTAVGPTAATN